MATPVCSLLLLLLLPLLPCCVGEFTPNPFAGQDYPPGSDDGRNLPVTVSFYIDQLLDVDQYQYSFSASVQFQFQWVDIRFAGVVENATRAAQDGERECSLPCSNFKLPSDSQQLCCDGVFLPSLFMLNTKDYPSNTMVYSIAPCSSVPNSVTWRVQFIAIWYTAMNFGKYPSDQQQLKILLYNRTPNTTLVPAAALFRSNGALSDFVAGWYFDSIAINDVTGVNLKDYFDQDLAAEQALGTCLVDSLAGFSVALRNGVNINLTIQRIQNKAMLNVVIPVFFIGLLGFAGFLFDPVELGTRLGLAASLFVALQAIQFVIFGYQPNASQLLPTEKLVITWYVLLILVILEAFFVYRIATRPQRQERRRKKQQYMDEFMREKRRQMGAPISAVRGVLMKKKGVDAGVSAADDGAAGNGLRSKGSSFSSAAPEAAAAGTGVATPPSRQWQRQRFDEMGRLLAASWKAAEQVGGDTPSHRQLKQQVLQRLHDSDAPIAAKAEALAGWQSSGVVSAGEAQPLLSAMYEQQLAVLDGSCNGLLPPPLSTRSPGVTAAPSADQPNCDGGDSGSGTRAGGTAARLRSCGARVVSLLPVRLIPSVLLLGLDKHEAHENDESYAHFAARATDLFWSLFLFVGYTTTAVLLFVIT